MWSNFIKNPFCYFSISSINSKRPISQIFCVNVLESVQNIFFFMQNIEKSLFLVHNFFRSAIWGVRFRWATRYFGGSGLAGPPVTIQKIHLNDRLWLFKHEISHLSSKINSRQHNNWKCKGYVARILTLSLISQQKRGTSWSTYSHMEEGIIHRKMKLLQMVSCFAFQRIFLLYLNDF